MKKPKVSKEEKLSFNKIEVLIMIVLVALIIVSLTLVVTITTKNRNISNFKNDSEYIISAAKNAYNSFKISEKTSGIVTGSDGSTLGMCITVKGLKENEFLTSSYKNYEGYVVIEESQNHTYNYSLWLTNKKYVINGYDSKEIKNLSSNKGIEKYNDDEFTSKVRTSFTGTTKDKGGLSIDQDSLKRYEAACINEKIE